MRPLLPPGAAPPLRSILRRPLRREPPFRRYESSKREQPPNLKNNGDQPIPIANTVPRLPLWQRLGPLTTAASAYARAQKRRPWRTQFFSALVIYCMADISAQTIGSDDDFDPTRTARSLLIGGVASIPSYLWFMFLSHHFNYASHALSLLVKIVVNQMVFTPTFNTYFFGSQALLSGCDLQGVVDRVVKTVPTSFINSCQFWPIVTAFSFTFVPIEYRSVFAGVIAIGWQTYLTLLNRRAEEKAKVERGEMTEAMVS